MEDQICGVENLYTFGKIYIRYTRYSQAEFDIQELNLPDRKFS